jgi:dTDP-4-amino-4,6-dideoxygalactose transaminase
MSNTKKIPFVDLVSQHSRLSKEIEEAIGDVLARGSFTLGGTVQRFEEEFAAF